MIIVIPFIEKKNPRSLVAFSCHVSPVSLIWIYFSLSHCYKTLCLGSSLLDMGYALAEITLK